MRLVILLAILSIHSCKIGHQEVIGSGIEQSQVTDLDLVVNQIKQQKGSDSLDINLIGLDSMTLIDWNDQNPKVLYLFFGESRIIELELDFSQMTNLKKLVMSKTHLKNITKSIIHLKNLEELSIHGSQIEEFPIEICSLSNLKKLVFWRSKLTTIPDEISNLKKLEELKLIENQFSKSEKQKIRKLLPNCKITFDY